MVNFALFLCQTRDAFLSSKLEELLQLMIEVLPLCHFSAKRHRLDCLYFLIVHVSKVNYRLNGFNSSQLKMDCVTVILLHVTLGIKFTFVFFCWKLSSHLLSKHVNF